MLILKAALSLLVLVAGTAKLSGAKMLADQFTEFGLPRWAMFAVGALEVAAGVGLHIAPLAFAASTGLIFLLSGAVAQHLRVKHPLSQAAPAAVVVLLAVAHSALTWPL